MPPNHSACIPPPSDYTPRPRQPHSSSKHRGGRGGGHGHHNRRGQSSSQHSTLSFHQDFQDVEDRLKNQPKDKFHHNEDDDYFARVQDEDDKEKAALAEAELRKEDQDEDADSGDDDEEDDPLDAYMKSLEDNDSISKNKSQTDSPEAEAERQEAQSATTSQSGDKRGVRLDIDDTDDIEESFYKYVEESRKKQTNEIDDYEMEEKQKLIEYDKDGNVISVKKVKREIDPLPFIDHSTIKYEAFEKNFYQEHVEISRLEPSQVVELRAKLEIKVSGETPPKPVCSFAHFKFDQQLMRVIRRSEYTQPTPIQAQAIPAALLGRNIIGIAMTGSGKTAAFLWPMIVHIMGQPDLKRGDGPIGLVLVPTRELALQVYGEAKKFSNSYKIAVVCAYGGGSKYEQSRDLEDGAEIVVATPGRLIDLIKTGATNLRRVTYLVLDEADRFFEMGFEAQVRSICDHIRPDRQTLLFSATFKQKIEQLAMSVTNNPIKIVQKSLGEANEDVTQHVIVLPALEKKWNWLTEKLVEFTSAGSVLIFVTRIINSEELNRNLLEFGKETLLLHGDMEQSERNRVITSFKRKEKDIMIATDVAARGLDISHIRTVINYDVARDIDTHIHRVGRTGRAGSKGDAYTLITEKDKTFAGSLVKNFEASNQKVGDDLMKLAMQDHAFRRMRLSKQHNRTSSHHRPSNAHYRSHHHKEGYRSDSHGHSERHSGTNHDNSTQFGKRHHHVGDRYNDYRHKSSDRIHHNNDYHDAKRARR